MVLSISTAAVMTTTMTTMGHASLPTPVSPSTPAYFDAAPSAKGARAGLYIDTSARAQMHPPTPVSPRASTSTSTTRSAAPYPFYTPRRLRAASTAVATPTSALLSPADPYTDVTRLRVDPAAHARHPCLYPGAVFAGTQRSGRNAYDVRVTLATVDLRGPAPHLCGYLRIRGLTDEHPELTTYFDADVCASFRTPGGWGGGGAAAETRDWQHWTRFPAFRRLRVHDLDARPPHPASGGPVFMRWKEQFLVPDHRVRDINGASFAGFYYVCVDLDAPSAPSPAALAAAATRRRAATMPSLAAQSADVQAVVLGTCAKPAKPVFPDVPPCSAPMGYDDEDMLDIDADVEPDFLDTDADAPPGTGALMTGFYYHPNSDPFQKLSLRHVKDESHAGFEFR